MRATNVLHALKTKISTIVRWVREGHRIVATAQGNPTAVIRPTAVKASDLNTRLAGLAERGVVIRPAQRAIRGGPFVRKPGALERFLDDRGE